MNNINIIIFFTIVMSETQNIKVPSQSGYEETRLDEDEDLQNANFRPESLNVVTGNMESIHTMERMSNLPTISCLFCKLYKIGNTFALNFDEYNRPKYVIGPHWYLYLVMNLIILVISGFTYIEFLSRILGIWMKIVFFLSMFFLLGVYFMNFISNPGIVLSDGADNLNGEYCKICQKFIIANTNTVHCQFCNVCVQGYDHHCVWIGKCVGKDNLKKFYFLLGTVGVIYSIIFGAAIYYVIRTVAE